MSVTNFAADVSNSARFELTQFSDVNDFLWSSSSQTFSLAKMASEAQNPLAKMEFLLAYG